MPRAAQLGLGAVAGSLALVVGAGSVLLTGIAIALVGLAHRRWRGVGLIPIGVGLALLGTRGLLVAAPGVAFDVPEGRGSWITVVESVGAPRTGSRPAIVRLETAPEVRLAVTLPWFPPVGPSDRISVSGGVLAPPDGPYGDYLRRIGVVGTLHADGVELLSPEAGPARGLEDLRRAAAEAISLAIPEPEAGLAEGVLIGLRDRVDRSLAADFTTAGASHVVAISGWNIAIVASTLAAAAGSLDRRRRALLTAIAIVAYVAFVGPSASVVRAAAMAGIALLARELGRPGTAAAALGWAVTLLLLTDPAWIDDAGFRLSALATAGIVAWGSSWTRRLGGPAPGRARRWLAEILGVSLAAQVATLPIVLLDFGRLSLVAPFVNLVVVPIVPPAMAAGALALGGGIAVLGGMPAGVAVIVGLPAWALYGVIVAAVRAGAAAPFASLELSAPWDGIAAASSAGLILGTWRYGPRLAVLCRARPGGDGPREPPRRATLRADRRVQARANRLAAGALALAIASLGLAVAHRPDGIARVVILDVGQGDAILVEGGQGSRLLVDGGPDPGRLLVALDERLPPWDHRIDAVVLTHPHEDHVAGLVPMLERYRVDRVYEPGMLGPGPGYAAWQAALEDPAGPIRRTLATGDRLVVDEVRLRVLWPDPGRVPEQPASTGAGVNNVSIVLLGEFRGQRFLLTGDIEDSVDPELVARGLPGVAVLKVAHHGSRTASSVAFLEATRPRVAIVSTGRGNSYGHPTPETLARLGDVAKRTYRTDRDGTVEVALDGATVRVAATHAGGGAAAAGLPGNGLAPGAPSGRPEDGAIPARATAVSAASSSSLRLPRPAPGSVEGRRRGLRYHRPDGERIELGDRLAARAAARGVRVARPARLPVGRRCVWHRSGPRVVPPRAGTLPRGAAGALAPDRRPGRARPPPR